MVKADAMPSLSYQQALDCTEFSNLSLRVRVELAQ